MNRYEESERTWMKEIENVDKKIDMNKSYNAKMAKVALEEGGLIEQKKSPRQFSS